MIGVSLGIACNPRGESFGFSGAVEGLMHYSWQHGIDAQPPLRIASADVGHNRSEITMDFRHKTTNDWLMFLDDDTCPPVDALCRLIDLYQPYCAGVYYYKTREKGFEPLIYSREPNGRYKPFTDYHRGEIVQVDSVGMGCTLIHRMVFEGILNRFNVGLRPNGSVTLVKKGAPKAARYGVKIGDSKALDKYDAIPFFLTDQGRTEDHWFAELAEVAGYKPVIDTMVECSHIGEIGTTGANYRWLRAEKRHDRQVLREMARSREAVA